MEENQINEVEENQEVESTETERDYEAEARQQGWVPKEDYKNPEKWVDAKTFVERGEIFRPALNAKYKEAENKLAEFERKFAEQEAAIERNNKIAERMMEKAREDALEKLRAEQRIAFEQGDDARYNELDKRRDKLAEEFRIEPVKKIEVQAPDPYVSKFQQDNPWYNQDLVLTNMANAIDASLIASGRFGTVESRHAEVKRQIVEAFPHKFENPNRTKSNGLGVGRSPAKPSTTKKGWDSIPEADKKIAMGFLRSTGKSQEEYAKTYWEMENA